MKPNSFLREEATLKLEGNWGNMALTTLVFFVCLYFAFLVPYYIFLSSFMVHLLGNPALLSETSNPNSLQILSDMILPLGGYYLSYYVILILLVPFFWGYITIFLNLYRKGKTDVSNLFDGYSKFKKVFFPMLLCAIYLWLWNILFSLGAYLLIALCLFLKLDPTLSIFIGCLALIPYYVKCYSYAMTPYIVMDYPNLTSNEAIEESMRMMDGYKWKLFLLHLSFIGWGILAIFTCCIGFLWFCPYYLTAQAAFYEDRKAEFYPETTEEEPVTEEKVVVDEPVKEEVAQKEETVEPVAPQNEDHYDKG